MVKTQRPTRSIRPNSLMLLTFAALVWVMSIITTHNRKKLQFTTMNKAPPCAQWVSFDALLDTLPSLAPNYTTGECLYCQELRCFMSNYFSSAGGKRKGDGQKSILGKNDTYRMASSMTVGQSKLELSAFCLGSPFLASDFVLSVLCWNYFAYNEVKSIHLLSKAFRKASEAPRAEGNHFVWYDKSVEAKFRSSTNHSDDDDSHGLEWEWIALQEDRRFGTETEMLIGCRCMAKDADETCLLIPSEFDDCQQCLDTPYQQLGVKQRRTYDSVELDLAFKCTPSESFSPSQDSGRGSFAWRINEVAAGACDDGGGCSYGYGAFPWLFFGQRLVGHQLVNPKYEHLSVNATECFRKAAAVTYPGHLGVGTHEPIDTHCPNIHPVWMGGTDPAHLEYTLSSSYSDLRRYLARTARAYYSSATGAVLNSTGLPPALTTFDDLVDGPLRSEESLRSVLQTALPPARRPRLASDVKTATKRHSHPYSYLARRDQEYRCIIVERFGIFDPSCVNGRAETEEASTSISTCFQKAELAAASLVNVSGGGGGTRSDGVDIRGPGSDDWKLMRYGVPLTDVDSGAQSLLTFWNVQCCHYHFLSGGSP